VGISMAHLNTVIVGVFTGAACALVAVSVTLMFRSTGVLSFAHAAFAATGAYLYADLAGNRGFPRPLAALAALAVTVAYGLAVERFAIRPVRHAGSAARLMATVGVLSLTTGLLLQFFGFQPTAAPLLLPDVNVAVGSLRLALQQIAILAVAGAGALGLGVFLMRTRFGTGLRAVAENPEAARLMGVSLTRVARFNWALGAAITRSPAMRGRQTLAIPSGRRCPGSRSAWSLGTACWLTVCGCTVCGQSLHGRVANAGTTA